MKRIFQSARSVAANWFGDGPWRSKSVLAALAAVLTGMGLWFAEIKNGPPLNAEDSATTNAPAITSLDPTSPPPVGTQWNWSKPFPGYVPAGASYVAAYCIGWVFRRLLRIILVISVLVLALLGLGKFAGWDLKHTQEQIKRGGAWARHEATTEKDYLKSLLPSATAGGIGIFMGFRRRNRAVAPEPVA